jgi:hypothetical protein
MPPCFLRTISKHRKLDLLWYVIGFVPLLKCILIMGVRPTSHWTAATFTGLLFVPGWEWMSERTFFFNFRKFGAHGMILTGENRWTRRKTCPSATLSTTNPTGLTRARTWAAAVWGRRLTAWATTVFELFNIKYYCASTSVVGETESRRKWGKRGNMEERKEGIDKARKEET